MSGFRVVILGCGGSGGVPLIGGIWGACDPDNPRNRRLRPSILVEHAGTRVLVDTGPDIRQQLLAAGVGTLDAVLYTHAHADHLHGIDELRRVNANTGRPLDIYADEATISAIRQRFPYVFEPLIPNQGYYKPCLVPHAAEPEFAVGALPVRAFPQDHGFGRRTLGFRFGPVAYSTDVLELDEAAFAVLAGVKLWIVDCLQIAPHPTHAHLEKTLSWIARVGPERAVLTHMNHHADYAELCARTPENVEPAYDGMVLEVPG